MFRGDSMKSLFIILISFSLFISGCELIDERGNPRFSYPSEDGPMSMQLDIGKHGGRGHVVLTSICENAFYGTCGNPNGEDIAEVHCSSNMNLGCAGMCYVAFDSQVCGFFDPGLGSCYCLNDGVCDDIFGEPITSDDCDVCTSGETQSCNLPQVPGTCGECNAGLKTCTNGQWGTCDQVTNPIVEDCDNGLDDDCDCTPDEVDADCFYTHLECQNGQCIEADGQGSDQCSGDGDCTGPAVCGNGVLEAGEQCDIDLSSWDPNYLHSPYLPVYGHYMNYDLGNCDVCDMGNDPSFSSETCVCADSYPGDGIMDGAFNLVESFVGYEACEVDIYPEIYCAALNQEDCQANGVACSWRDAYYNPPYYCAEECISNVGCYVGPMHDCAAYDCPLQEIANAISMGEIGEFIWNDVQSPNEDSWIATCGVVG